MIFSMMSAAAAACIDIRSPMSSCHYAIISPLDASPSFSALYYAMPLRCRFSPRYARLMLPATYAMPAERLLLLYAADAAAADDAALMRHFAIHDSMTPYFR